ncbi:DUF1178 family protein [Nitrobacteraceae bacterium UC4446_H13]|jgi:hypothetical protein
MIKYDLRCEQGHAFESWFQSSSAYDSQRKRKLIACPSCGSSTIEKAIMAPRLSGTRKRGRIEAPSEVTPAETQAPSLVMTQELELRAKLKELRDHVVKNADNVGERFPNEARKMHYGDIEHRPIYGEASADEAKSLIDEGIEVTPLPALPEDRN